MSGNSHSSPPPSIVLDRNLFLRALQNCNPGFWNGFRRSALEGVDGDRLSPEEWATCAGVVDGWFIQVLRDTLARWIAQPDHAGSSLQPGYEWFVYVEYVAMQPFAPTFDDPYLLVNGRTPKPDLSTNIRQMDRAEITQSLRIETVREFADRMTKQFGKQLAAHKKYLSHLAQADLCGERTKHAEWVALVFSGKTVAEIAEKWEGLQNNRDPYSAVHKAIARFAVDIGLTRTWTEN
jgi:hypothetical protein